MRLLSTIFGTRLCNSSTKRPPLRRCKDVSRTRYQWPGPGRAVLFHVVSATPSRSLSASWLMSECVCATRAASSGWLLSERATQSASWLLAEGDFQAQLCHSVALSCRGQLPVPSSLARPGPQLELGEVVGCSQWGLWEEFLIQGSFLRE
eukprot:2419721-Rhodomonas_salina.5